MDSQVGRPRADGRSQASRAAATHPGLRFAYGQAATANAQRAAQERSNRRAMLFRAPQSVDDAHALLTALGDATQDDTVSMHEYRTQADHLMGYVMGVRAANPANPLVQQSSHAFIIRRAEGDAAGGENVDSVMQRYGFNANDLGMRRRLEAAQQEPEEDRFAFSV